MTVSYETAKRLKELGIDFKNACFYYDGDGGLQTCRYMVYAAPMLHELLSVMPDVILIDGTKFNISVSKNGGHEKLYCAKLESTSLPSMEDIAVVANYYYHENPAEACGLLLIWLKENKSLEEG